MLGLSKPVVNAPAAWGAAVTSASMARMGAGAHISGWQRLQVVVVLASVVVGTYIYLNQYPPFVTRSLPLTPLDHAVPFLVWSVWPYAALNFSNAVLPFFVVSRASFWRMAVTLAIALAVCATFWALWPTTLARPPLPQGDDLSSQLYRFLVRVDQPVNCFPSAHVAAPAVQMYFVCQRWPRAAGWLWTGFSLCALSILTTKQHYVWDLLGAVVVVLLALMLTRRWPRRAQAAQS